jgi:integrase
VLVKFVNVKSIKINTRTNKLISPSTIKCLNQSKQVLKDFEKATRFKVDFNTLNMEFYSKFSIYCEKIKKFRSNTFGKHIGNIKEVLKSAEIAGIKVVQDYKLQDYRAPRELTTSVYLMEYEISQLINLDLSQEEHLGRTRDFFVIGCYTGLRWSDFSNLGKADFTHKNLIRIIMVKTQKMVTIPILKPILPTLESYKTNGKYFFPKPISNQKFNEQIKEISRRIPCLNERVKYISTINGKEIIEEYFKWEMVSSHTCRRSFATNMYLRGIDTFLIMKMTGHKTEKQFYEYIKIDATESADKFLDQFNQTSK